MSDSRQQIDVTDDPRLEPPRWAPRRLRRASRARLLVLTLLSTVAIPHHPRK